MSEALRGLGGIDRGSLRKSSVAAVISPSNYCGLVRPAVEQGIPLGPRGIVVSPARGVAEGTPRSSVAAMSMATSSPHYCASALSLLERFVANESW